MEYNDDLIWNDNFISNLLDNYLNNFKFSKDLLQTKIEDDYYKDRCSSVIDINMGSCAPQN